MGEGGGVEHHWCDKVGQRNNEISSSVKLNLPENMMDHLGLVILSWSLHGLWEIRPTLKIKFRPPCETLQLQNL